MKRFGTAVLASLLIAAYIPAGLTAAGAASEDTGTAGQATTTNEELTGFRVGRKTVAGTKVAPFNSSNIEVFVPDGPPLDHFQSLTGPAAGIFVSFNVGGPVQIQPELFYSRRGSRIQEGEDQTVYKLDYLEVPLLLKLVPLTGAVSPFLLSGAYGSLLLNARGVMTVEGRSVSEDMKGFFKGSDYGLVFGGGFQLLAGRILLLVESRYTVGLANIAKEIEEGSVNNKGLAVLFGVGF